MIVGAYRAARTGGWRDGGQRAEATSWGAAYLLACLLFFFWPQVSELVNPTLAKPGTVNAVTIVEPDHFEPAGAHRQVMVHYGGPQLKLSEGQVSVVTSFLLVGWLGGLFSSLMYSGRWSLISIVGSLMAALVWAAATLVGLLVLVIALYVFGGLLGALLRPAPGIGVVLGFTLGGFIAGSAASLIGLPTQRLLLRGKTE